MYITNKHIHLYIYIYVISYRQGHQVKCWIVLVYVIPFTTIDTILKPLMKRAKVCGLAVSVVKGHTCSTSTHYIPSCKLMLVLQKNEQNIVSFGKRHANDGFSTSL